ncbi:MAG: hypothetical protein RR513_03010 [Muribaculaceae bacterium]
MMKKVILIIGMAFICAIPTFAAGLKIESRYTIKLDNNTKAFHPVISSDGLKLLFSTESYMGLNLLDLKNNSTTTISESIGAGFEPIFSNDGKSVYYKSTSVNNRLRSSNVERYEISTAKSKEILPQSRESVLLSAHKSGVIIKSGKKMMGVKKGNVTIAYTDYNRIIINNGGVEKSLNPIADAHSYMWVSVSPDGNKLLFVEPFKGIFVCDINGENLHGYGKGSAPIWYGNNFIIATKSTDDGYIVLSSQLYAINLNTSSALAITSSDEIVDDHTASFDAGKVVYSTIQGELKVLKVNVEE